MRISHSLAIMAAILMASSTLTQAQQAAWGDSSWAPMDVMHSRRSTEEVAEAAKPAEEVQGRNYAVNEEPTYSNDTDVNSLIDQILNSRREGRNLGEYDQVYADGNIEQALQQGNEPQARNLIRDKLCGLGLMSCDVEEKRPYYSTIYAQGPPPPLGFNGGPYGPARPMPPPNHYNSRPPPQSSLNSFGPPRKVGYENGPYKPNFRPSGPGPMYNGPYLENPPPSAVDGGAGHGGFNKPPPGAVIYGSKPPGPIYSGGNSDSPPYNFENPGGEKIIGASSQQNNFYSHQSAASSSASSASNIVIGGPGALSSASAAAAAAALQQHVHHHYHHVEGADAIGAKIPSVPIPIGAGQSINTDFSALAQSSAGFAPQTQGGFSQSSAFNAGFNGASQGGLLTQASNGFGEIQKPVGGIYNPTGGLSNFGGISGSYQQGQGSESSGFGQSGLGQSGLGQSGLGQSSGSYHSQNPDYFKKELHNTGGISASNNFNGISNGYDGQSQYQGGYETSRQQIVDCQCVPFNQCPAADRIGRKEDLILAIDPRNLGGKDIEALSDEAAANITTNANPEPKDKKDTETVKEEDDKKRSKREVKAEDKQSDDGGDLPLDAEGRQAIPGLPALELIKRQILPTYGVSFGLPYPSGGGGYPGNPQGGYYPGPNPHFGSIGPNGLNLGLLNVNPLVSVQVSKTEYGDKVVKPLVNLHVTPNANILEKVGDLFKRKPGSVQNTHYHHHDHYTGLEHDHDHHHGTHVVSGPGPIEHYASSGPSSSYIEMIPSKPIFEYHSGPAVPPPIHYEHHHESQNYETAGHSSFGQTTFAQQQPHQTTGPQYYPSTTIINVGTSASYPTGSAGHHHESQHYETAGHSSFGQTSFAQQQPHQTTGPQYYPSTGISNVGSSTSYPTGSAGFGYEQSQSLGQIDSHIGSEFGSQFGNNGQFGASNYGGNSYGNSYDNHYERSANVSQPLSFNGHSASSKYQEFPVEQNRRGKNLKYVGLHQIPTPTPGAAEGSAHITFPRDRRRRRSVEEHEDTAELRDSVLARSVKLEQRAYYGNRPVEKTCRNNEVCCRRPLRPPQQQQQLGKCGTRNAAGITGRIKNPVYVDGDSEFGEYPWHVAILKKDPKESIYACGATLIDAQHVITAAHCIKSQNGFDLRARLGEWDVNHDVEFFPYIERDVVSVHIHPEYYAGTLDNDLAILKLDHPVDFTNNPHISPACLPDKFSDFTGARCWTTGWGKDAFGEHGKYQNILKEVDVPILSHQQCEQQLRNTRLGFSYKLNPGFVCAGGEEGKDACKGDGGGPLVCERNGIWNVVGVVSWGIGCGQVNVPGVYVRVAHYLDWIRQITQYYK